MERKCLGAAVAACSLVGLAGMASATVNIDLVPVGNVGNAADGTGYGRVDYAYNIGKYEVTAGQYAEFLNAVAVTDTYALYNPSMASDTWGCQIQRTGSSGSFSYIVAPAYANRPVNYVSFWDSLRFANWLGNGQGTGSTETGAYTLTSGGISGNTITRNTGWQYAVTSEDEWYKAAYYTGSGYSLYANGTSTAPVAGTDANYDMAVGSTWDGTVNGTAEQNGTKDMTGNVWEWNEAIILDQSRGLRGGAFYDSGTILQSGIGHEPTYEAASIGFRVSQVPEPTTAGLLGLGVIGMLLRRRTATK